MRSHPPTLLTSTRRTLLEGRLAPPGSRVLVAVSGGPDSMALLHVLASLRAPLGFDLVAHGVNHGLRAEAASELELAESFALRLRVPFERTMVDVRRGGNLQARARAARMGALRSAAESQGADRIATAHHADDRAETVLLRLLRGASPAGLAVLPPSEGDRIRPFIRARRRDIEAHVERHGVPFATDPSNHDPRFLRVRVRIELLPLLSNLSPGIVDHLNGLADDLLTLNSGNSRDTSYGGPPIESCAEQRPFLRALPRATRLALAALATSGSRDARVALGHGVVASLDPPRSKK